MSPPARSKEEILTSRGRQRKTFCSLTHKGLFSTWSQRRAPRLLARSWLHWETPVYLQFLPKQRVKWAWFACTWTLVFKWRTVYHGMGVGRHFRVIFNLPPSGSIWVEHKTNMKPKFTFWIHLASKASLYLEPWKYSSLPLGMLLF